MWLDNCDDLLEYLEIDEFDITDITESGEYGKNYIDAFCINKDGEYEGIRRTFKICRFDSIEFSLDDND